MFISDEGVRFIVEEGKYVQAGVDIRKEMFKVSRCCSRYQ